MKAFMTLFTLAIFTAFVWFLFFELDLSGGAKVEENASSFSPITETIDKDINNVGSEEANDTVVEVYEEDVEENTEESEEVSPEDSLTLPGSTITRGSYLYYDTNNYMIQTRVVDVVEASADLTTAVKTDIPEAGGLKIWRVIFEQSLYDGSQVYGDASRLERFNVISSSGGEAYLLNSTGDYEGCGARSLFDKDFAEEGAVYRQCFIVASESEPNLIFVGGSGSEFSSSPVLLD